MCRAAVVLAIICVSACRSERIRYASDRWKTPETVYQHMAGAWREHDAQLHEFLAASIPEVLLKRQSRASVHPSHV
jgi:hypothetical protein